MRFATAQPLKPLEVSRTPRAAPRPLARSDLAPAARLAKPAQTQHQRLVGQTQKWVAQTFYGTLMKQMEQSPFKSDLFSGGRGGQAFSSLYHQQLADRMARGAGGKLVNTIVRRIEAKAAKSGAHASQKAQNQNSNPRQLYHGPQKRVTRARTLDLLS